MNLIRLPVETRSATGFTHKLVLTYADLKTWTSGTAQAVFPENALGASSKTMPVGMVVGRWVANVTTAFAVQGQTITTFTFSLGDGSSSTRFVNAVDLKTTGFKATTMAAYQYVAADTIDAVATFTLSAHTIAELTAGQIEIYFDAVDVTGLTTVAEPIADAGAA